MNRWTIGINVCLFVLVVLAIHFYQLHHDQVDPKACKQQYAFAAGLPLAKTEIAHACELLARLNVPLRDRALGLCILRDTEALVTNNPETLATYLELCYKAYLK